VKNCTLSFLVVLSWAAASATLVAAEPKRLLLIGQGPDGHPAGTHEFFSGLAILEACLDSVEAIEIQRIDGSEPWPAGPQLIRDCDGVVLYLAQGGRWMQSDPRRFDALQQLLARGGGVVALHWAIGAKDAQYIEGCKRILGGCHGGADRKYIKVETDLRPAEGKHPIANGIAPLQIYDEFYYQLKFVDAPDRLRPVLVATIEGQPETVAWSYEPASGGRSFGFSGLHFHRHWVELPYRRLASQAVLWSLDLSIPSGGLDVTVPDELLESATNAVTR